LTAIRSPRHEWLGYEWLGYEWLAAFGSLRLARRVWLAAFGCFLPSLKILD
jgi:hypothetical protein